MTIMNHVMSIAPLISLVGLLCFGIHTAAVAQSSAPDGETVVNDLLAGLTPELNKVWPTVAVQNGLDPLPLKPFDVKLKCKYGGDEICGLQASSCEKMWAEIEIKSIKGLAYMQFKDLAMTAVSSKPGTQACPYNTKTKVGPYSYSFWGEGGGGAYLVSGGTISAEIKKVKVKVQCNALGGLKKFTETMYSGSGRCTATKPQGTGTFHLCAGTCTTSPPVSSLAYSDMENLDFSVGNLSCDVDPSYSPTSWIADTLVPKLEDEIVGQITKPIENALNDTFEKLLPYPSKCP